MLGVRIMEYNASKRGIDNYSKMNDCSSGKSVKLIYYMDNVPDRIRRKDFVKAKLCIPNVTRFQIGEGDDAVVYIYDENSDCMVKQNV